MKPLVDARDFHFPTEVPFVESVSTNSILDLLMVAFISRYFAMAIMEVDMLSQYSDVHGSRELIVLSVNDLCAYFPLLLRVIKCCY